MISEKQLKILAFPYTAYDALICDGAIRSGKTSIMTVAFVDWAMRNFNHRNFAICGKTVGSAIKNIVVPYLASAYAKGKYNLTFTRSDNKMIVRKGTKENIFYIYGGKDESSYMLIQGITLSGVLLDEVALMTRSFVEQSLARCSVDGSRFWFNCNPASPNHWFYTEWILKTKEKNVLHLHFYLRDNPALSENIIKRYETQYTGVFYKRYILGEWVVAEGLVYQNYNNNINNKLWCGNPDDLQGIWYLSVDYGTINPCSMGLWCVTQNKAIRVKEYYWNSRKEGRQCTDEEYYTELEKLAGNYEIQYVVIDPSAASFIATINRHNKYFVLKAKNDVINGIRVTAQMLESGLAVISDKCCNSVEEFGMYRWDTDSKSDKDTVIKENDHAMDDIRYFCYTVLANEFYYEEWADEIKKN